MLFLNTNESDTHPVPARYIPKITLVYILICAALFGLVHAAHDPYSWGAIESVGGGSADDIWSGHLSGFFINNFIHIEIWHIAFNLYWLVIFGRKIEYEQGSWFFLFLTLTAGLVSSGCQLALEGIMGIGFSGIGYALFGYLFIKVKYDDRYKGFLTHQVQRLFIIWFFFCIAATAADIWRVGNGAHLGGMLWGMLLGYLPLRRRAIQVAITMALFSLSIVPAFYAPWQIPYLEIKSYNLHSAHKYDEALAIYNAILARDPSNSFAKNNKKEIVDYKNYLLKMSASVAMANHEYKKAISLYDDVLAVNPTDSEAVAFKAAVEEYLRKTNQ